MRFRLKNGLAIGYKTRGIGPTIIAIPSIGCTKDMWDPVIAELERDYRIIAIDVRGHGDSDTPGESFTMEDLADDVVELAKAIGGGKVIVGGCSLGGQVAQCVGLKAPEILNGIFISNTAHRRNDKIREVMENRARSAQKGMPDGIWTTLNRWFNAEYQKAHPEHIKLAYDWLANTCPIAHAWCWRAIKGLDTEQRLKSLTVPALAIAGGDDQSSSAADVKQMADDIPDCMYRVCEGAGHLSPLEQPREYAGFLKEFAEKVCR